MSFINKFEALIGDTPFNYLIQWRLLQARELLKKSNKSIEEIVEDIGYQSKAAFNGVFKKKVEQTPLKFKQNILVS